MSLSDYSNTFTCFYFNNKLVKSSNRKVIKHKIFLLIYKIKI